METDGSQRKLGSRWSCSPTRVFNECELIAQKEKYRSDKDGECREGKQAMFQRKFGRRRRLFGVYLGIDVHVL